MMVGSILWIHLSFTDTIHTHSSVDKIQSLPLSAKTPSAGTPNQSVTTKQSTNKNRLDDTESDSAVIAVGDTTVTTDNKNNGDPLPAGLRSVLTRAKEMRGICDASGDAQKVPLNPIDVRSFGIIDDFEEYVANEKANPSSSLLPEWQCQVPPSTSCHVERFTVIFLGYNPTRLSDVKRQTMRMLKGDYNALVEEIVLVWNNPEPIDKTPIGETLLHWSKRPRTPIANDVPNRFRIFFPIEHGLDSSLMNRYHPMIKPKSEGILYYDDDGPFYGLGPIQSAFELWKRNSDAQLGAMCRAFTLSDRQNAEKTAVLNGRDLDDRKWISHCRDHGDTIAYDYRFFTMFHANMVLPSGSFLHRNYLCFIWHPAFNNLRAFVAKHVVHPDDMTVSAIASHVSGRAPLTYSRRINPPKNHTRRRLTETELPPDSTDTTATQEVSETSPEGMWRTANWGQLRSTALNSVISYFGGINSGSYGWCYKTEYHKFDQKDQRHVCVPDVADRGMIPWLNEGGYQNDICPSSP